MAMGNLRALTLATVLAFMLGACSREPAPAPSTSSTAPAAGAEWTAFRDRVIEEYFEAQPPFAVDAGRHEFDGRLPDWSEQGLAREIERLHRTREAAAAFASAALPGGAGLERDHLLAQLDGDLFWLETADQPHSNPAFYLDSGLDPSPYLTREYAPLEARLRAYIGYARAIPQAAMQIKANLRMPLARPLLERGISGFRGFADFYRDDVPGIFASVKDDALQSQLKEANAAAEAAMRDLASWLESNRRTATGSFALGAERFAQMLQATERVTTPLAELEAAGKADLERNQAALREACAQYLPGKSIPECIARMSSDKPEGGPVAGAREQLTGLRDFIAQKNLVSIPGTEQALVHEAPAFNRANSAYISIPGPYEKGLASIYYIAPPDPAWTAKEQRDYIPGRADLLFTTVHEVWPGHFLQFLHSNRSASPIGRLFVGYAFAEGWAHYAEEMMFEQGVNGADPETHIGQLSNALLRNARFLSAIGLHTHGMTVAQSEKLFRDEAFSDVGTARQQAARGTYDPAYLNYTMGKLMIRKLRTDWMAQHPGADALREFHDKFLSYGGPPIPLVRAAMLGNDDGPLF